MTSNTKQVTPYEEEEKGKKAQVTTMFDRLAPYYDFLNRLLTLRIDVLWRRKAIKSLAPYQPQTILDIATGTADLAIEIAKQIQPKQIIGMDIAPQMLKVGQEKIVNKRLSDIIKLETGDSENLQYPDETFDAVTAAFGVRNFENLEKGLSEMFRVMQKGGHLMILEFSRPRVFPLKQVFNTYFKYILPVIGRVISKDPKAYKYLYESVQVFPDYENFTSILQKAGFRKTQWKALSFGICTIYTATKK